MVNKLRCRATILLAWIRVADRVVVLILLLCLAGSLAAQENEVHYLHQGVMPPGAIGSVQLQRGGPLAGFFQPVEIKAPHGVEISLAVGDQFEQPAPAPLGVGMLIGQVYRLRVTRIPLAEGVEVFPTIEVIDRLYTPEGQQRRFAIPIEIDEEDLRLAMQGKFVTRVIYLEDPARAVPVAETPRSQQPCLDVAPGRDPLAEADVLGRPVAILRLGGRVPNADNPGAGGFLFNSPPFERYPTKPKTLSPPPKRISDKSNKNTTVGKAEGIQESQVACPREAGPRDFSQTSPGKQR